MQSVTVIFSGLILSYKVLERAIEQAKAQDMELRVVFLSDKPVEEDYLFPSDIDAAEALTGTAEAEADDRALLHSKIRLINDSAKAAGIGTSIQVSENASVDSILKMVGNAAVIFVDGGTVSREGATGLLFNSEELSVKATCPVEVIEAL